MEDLGVDVPNFLPKKAEISEVERNENLAGGGDAAGGGVNGLWKVNSPIKSSTYYLLLLIKILSCRFCGGVDLLINR